MHEKHIPSFTWGSAVGGYTTYKLDKALSVNKIVMSRRKKSLKKNDEELLQNIFQLTIG